MIPMVDLQRQYGELRAEIDAAVHAVLDSGQFILGSQLASLEGEIAAYHGVPHAIGVGSGTDALLLALLACGIGRGDEVITTPFTFIATAEVIAHAGATPVFADIRPDTFAIDPVTVEERITKRTKAVVPVHLFGHPADMEAIGALAEARGLRVIEDCAQSFGATCGGKKTGTFGDCGCYSFFPSKNLAAYGDGGMVITRDDELASRIRLLRNHGSAVRYYHSALGYNSRLDELQAAVVRVKLKRIDAFNEARRRNADLYRAAITRDGVVLPREMPGCRHVYHQFTLRAAGRERIAAALQEQGIASAVYYPVPLHRQEVFMGKGGPPETLAVTEACTREVLSLPMFPELRPDEIARIGDVVNHAV
jgi:dTDP-4-amino-4,6-dideoxygalactose transaminase